MDNNIRPKKRICNRCGHIWYSRLERMPANCPRCKRYDYNKKKGAKKCKKK